jgi:excisionase family DNA binding protein
MIPPHCDRLGRMEMHTLSYVGDRPALLTVDQARAYLGGLSQSELRQLYTRGELACIRLGRRKGVRFRAADLDAYIDRRRTPAKAEAA